VKVVNKKGLGEVQGFSGSGVHGSRFTVHGSGFRVQGSGFTVQGSRFSGWRSKCNAEGKGTKD